MTRGYKVNGGKIFVVGPWEVFGYRGFWTLIIK
jgi:hypothetical protein